MRRKLFAALFALLIGLLPPVQVTEPAQAVIANQLIIFSSVLNPPGCPSQAIAFFNRLTTQPPYRNKVAYCSLVTAFVAAGVWSACDAIYAFAASNSIAALTNLESSSYSAVRSTPSPSFIPNVGFSTTVDGRYIDSTFVPSTAAGHYSLNSATIAAYTTTQTITTGAIIGNSGSPAFRTFIYPANTANATFINAIAVTDSAPPSNKAGLWASTYNGATATLSLNGTSLGTTASTTPHLPTTSQTFLADEGVSIIGTVNFGMICGYLSPTQVSAVNTAVVAYLHTLGVI